MWNDSFQIEPVPPFRLDLTAWALRRTAGNAVDRFENGIYSRVIEVMGEPVDVSVSQSGGPDDPRLKIDASASQAVPSASIRAAVERILGTGTDMKSFYARAEEDGRLGELVRRFRGVKPPRFPSVFEAVANAIACQQLSLSAGIQFLNRLAENYGAKSNAEGKTFFAFPSPIDLANRQARSLRKLGFSTQKSRALTRIAGEIAKGRLDLERIEDMTDEEALETLDEIPGIGRWSSEYVLLRGLGRVNIFPGDDIAGRNALKGLLNIKRDMDYNDVKTALAEWDGYGGLLYFHLRLRKLESSGYVHGR